MGKGWIMETRPKEDASSKEQDVNDSHAFDVQSLRVALPRERLLDTVCYRCTTIAGFRVRPARAVVIAGDGMAFDEENEVQGKSDNVKVHRVGRNFVFGNSGGEYFCQSCRDVLPNVIKEAEKSNAARLELSKCAEGVYDGLISIAKFIKGVSPKFNTEFSGLLGGFEKGTPSLYLIDNLGWWDMGDWHCTGSGEYYANLEAQRFDPSKGLHKAIETAFRSLFSAARCSYGTGGNVRALVIQDEGIRYFETSIKKLQVYFGQTFEEGSKEHVDPVPLAAKSVNETEQFISSCEVAAHSIKD